MGTFSPQQELGTLSSQQKVGTFSPQQEVGSLSPQQEGDNGQLLIRLIMKVVVTSGGQLVRKTVV